MPLYLECWLVTYRVGARVHNMANETFSVLQSLVEVQNRDKSFLKKLELSLQDSKVLTANWILLIFSFIYFTIRLTCQTSQSIVLFFNEVDNATAQKRLLFSLIWSAWTPSNDVGIIELFSVPQRCYVGVNLCHVNAIPTYSMLTTYQLRAQLNRNGTYSFVKSKFFYHLILILSSYQTTNTKYIYEK